MARMASGAVLTHTGKDGKTYRSLRFTAYGKRRFVSLGAVSKIEAETALRHTLVDVERGVWQPPQQVEAPAEPDPVPSFHAYAEQYWQLNEARWAPSTQEDYRRRLEKHLLPAFAQTRLDEITFAAVERYIAGKQADGLAPRTINMTVTLLGAILERAMKAGVIAANPVRDRELRVKERKPRRSYLDSAAQIEALLEAAGEIDAEATAKWVQRRAIIATLLFSGLRISELCELRWRDVDLAAGRIQVGKAKTEAGRRKVKMRGALRDELLRIKPENGAGKRYVFATSTGGKQSETNIRKRMLSPACERASQALEQEGGAPLPHLTPHSLRRTFASLLCALGVNVRQAMAEMGHTSAAFTLSVYAQPIDEGEAERLSELVEGCSRLPNGLPQSLRNPANSGQIEGV